METLQRRQEIKMEGSYKEQLAKAFEHLFPKEARERSVEEQQRLKDGLTKRERSIIGKSMEALARGYGADLSGIQAQGDCMTIDWDAHYDGKDDYEIFHDKVFSLPVRNHFSRKKLPKGYGYKGGAARALLLRSLNIDPNYTPRDLDVVRLAWKNNSDESDDQVSQEYMPEDYEHGNGVEVIDFRDNYLATRDFRLNEILATDDKIICTRGAIIDTIRHIIRPTQYERDQSQGYGSLKYKILSKALRFYTEAIHRYGDAGIEDIDDWEFEEGFITPFWLALQLDRACEVSMSSAEIYVDELKNKKQIPDDIETVEDAATYLLDLVYDFYYRHAPTEQFEIEYEWTEDFEEDLKKRRSVTGSKVGDL